MQIYLYLLELKRSTTSKGSSTDRKSLCSSRSIRQHGHGRRKATVCWGDKSRSGGRDWLVKYGPRSHQLPTPWSRLSRVPYKSNRVGPNGESTHELGFQNFASFEFEKALSSPKSHRWCCYGANFPVGRFSWSRGIFIFLKLR